MIQKWKQQSGLYWIMIASVLLFGGFYDWAAALIGAAVCVVGIRRIGKTKRYFIMKEKWFWLILIIELCLVISTITAVDKGMNLIGIIRFVPIVLWSILAMQYSEEERKSALDAIPHMGCITVVVGIVAFLLPSMREWFWAAERLGGYFQYSNTCAVFFLLGMMIIGEQKERIDKIQWTILFWGILLSGSRTVMLLLLVVLLIQFFPKKTEKKVRMLMVGNVIAAVVAAVIMVGLIGNYQNLARLATVFTSNSTFYGRLLYWKDAFGLILKNPLGLGWKGYYYIQPMVQTGVYTTMYVHNDLLQSFLDGGWISGVAFTALVFLGIKTSKQKGMLAVLFLHSLVDIDFQYVSIWFVAILLFDFGEVTMNAKKEKRREWQLGLGMIAAVCLYFCIPFLAEFLGNYELAIYFYPGYTQAKEELLAATGEIMAAEALADEILKSNPYISLAYDAKALSAYAKGDIQDFVENKKKVLEIERYDITHYQDYDYLLKEFAANAIRIGDMETAEYCQKQRENVPNLLKEVEARTSSLAWKLRDKPVLVME